MLNRRSFLAAAAGMAAGLALPEGLLARSAVRLSARETPAPVRVRGRVRAGRKGLAGVSVSDGLSVAPTDRDGRFELISSSARDFVFCSIPAGYRIPLNPTGTARFYHPLAPGPGGETNVLFELERLEGGDERHAMLLLADIQTQDRWETDRFHEQCVPDVIETVRALGGVPAFGIACGDIMFDDLSLFTEFERGVARMGIPFFQVVGNHDLELEAGTDEASAATFCRRFGPRYYSFDRGAVHYVVLDDVLWHGAGYVGYVERDQLTWLAADLARVEAGRPVVVAMHIPAYGTRHIRSGRPAPDGWNTLNNREELLRLLEPYRAHVVSGHTHENEHHWTLGVHEHVSGTVCGAWWSGPICCDGTPNGYSVYEVSGEEVRWRYKAAGFPGEHQIRAYLPGAEPGAPDELVANVWDADEGWTVVWYEDGERRGRMARRVGRDPVSVRIHAGDALPPRRTWAEPYPRWLYYAPVTPGPREVRVEARDRFGRTYTAVAGPVPEGMRAWDPGPAPPRPAQ